jgi:thiosulfate/3-mercaptopyruvate sulfurtransferase
MQQAYDSGDGMMAARLWWMLTVAGHPSALLLEGGWAKWKAEGRPSELYEPCTLKVRCEVLPVCLLNCCQV